MLLAVLDLARSGQLTENKVFYGPALIERYTKFFTAVRHNNDHPNPYFPFFHLTGALRGDESTFWHLTPLAGRGAVLEAMSTARSHAEISETVAYATLDPELHALLQDMANIDALSATLASHWFDRGLQDLSTVADQSASISRYERKLREGIETKGVRDITPPQYVRDPAFRRVVTAAYDYRCAATGVRILLQSGESMVEAAHLHPFSISADDDPRNGLALSPDMHWAMDQNLIAPGPDHRWHVSKILDRRIPDFQALCKLDGQKLLPPVEARLMPKRESLEWRLDRLRRLD